MNKPTVDDLRHRDTWSVKYRGVTIEISRNYVTTFNPYGTWCYYLILERDKLNVPTQPKDWEPAHEYDRYFNSWVTKNFRADMHGGVTYVELYCDDKVRVGCDYNHHFDQQHKDMFDESRILTDAIDSVDDFLEKYPDHPRDRITKNNRKVEKA